MKIKQGLPARRTGDEGRWPEPMAADGVRRLGLGEWSRLYLVRLAAFALLLVGIMRKNRRSA
jgi:hypothetical protein